jgi:hypothetical protein
MLAMVAGLGVGLAVGTAQAQCEWGWSSGFEVSGGVAVAAWDSVVFDDGSGPALYVAVDSGYVYKYDGTAWSAIAKTYGNTSGLAVGKAYSLAVVDPDGNGPLGKQLFVAGLFRRIAGPTGAPLTANSIARWDGSAWINAGASSMLATAVRDITGYDDGTGERLVAAGAFAMAPGYGIAIRSASNTWSLVGVGKSPYFTSSQEVSAVHAFDDGNGMALYVAGLFQGVGGVTSNGVVKWDGTNWVGMGSGLQYLAGNGGRIYDLIDFNDGTGSAIYASGNILSAGGDTSVRGVAKWNGTSWSGIGADYVNGQFGPYMQVIDNGSGPELFVTGRLGAMAQQGIASWNGTSWTGYGWAPGNTSDYPLSVVRFDGDGAGPVDPRLMFVSPYGSHQFDGTQWLDLPSHPDSKAITAVGQMKQVSLPEGDRLVAVGGFTQAADGTQLQSLASFDGSAWSEALGGLPTLEIQDPAGTMTGSAWAVSEINGEVYVGGNFTHINGTEARRIARHDGTTWVDVGGGVGGLENGASISRILSFNSGTGDMIVACGSFTTAGGTPVSNIAAWDGTQWIDLAGGVDAAIVDAVVHDDGTGPAVYVIGEFATAGGTPVSKIAKWDGSAWSDVGGGFNTTPAAIVSYDDGTGARLVVGGQFTSAGGVTVGRIASWDGSAWSNLGGGVTRAAAAPQIRALNQIEIDGQNYLAVGGIFDAAGSTTVNHIALWNGSAWTALDGGTSNINRDASGTIHLIGAVESGPASGLYVYGSFDFAGDVSSDSFARWMTVGGVSFSTEPSDQAVTTGGPLTLEVVAAGATGYQWRKDGSAIAGATSSVLTIAPVMSEDAGGYDCVVTGICGEATTRTAVITVLCGADFDLTGFVDTEDYDAFVVAFEAGDESADIDGSGFVDTDDFDAFVEIFEAGC